MCFKCKCCCFRITLFKELLKIKMCGNVILTWRLSKLLKRSYRAVKEFGDKPVCCLVPSVNDLDNTLNIPSAI